MSKFTPQEITRFKEFLNQEERVEINPCVSSPQVKEIVSLVFQILHKRLSAEFEQADIEMAGANGQ